MFLDNSDYCAPILSINAMRSLDSKEKNGDIKAGYKLMQIAAQSLFEKACEMLKSSQRKRIAILIGGGNNGGDGLVCAKLMQEHGFSIALFALTNPEDYKNESLLAYNDFIKNGGKIFSRIFEIADKLNINFDNYDLIVDAMLGNGFHGEVREPYKKIIELVNKSSTQVLSADIPSGYNCVNHEQSNSCIYATETLMFGMPKIDPFTKTGAECFGKTTIVELPFSKILVNEFSENVFLANEKLIQELLPKRDEFANKRSIGTALVIAGSLDMPGAAALCTEAALRSGAGLVTLATSKTIIPILQTKLSECVFCNLPDNGSGFLQPENTSKLLQLSSRSNAIALGPGLSTEKSAKETVLEFLSQIKEIPLVIDADALNAISDKFVQNDSYDKVIDFIASIKSPAIFTPHIREWERLFGNIPNNPSLIIQRIQCIAKKTNKIFILKNSPIYIGLPNGNTFIVPAQNSGMAKGGSGDVLTGILVSLLSQNLQIDKVAILGVLLHQKAGLITRNKLGAFFMLPSDIIKNLYKAFV